MQYYVGASRTKKKTGVYLIPDNWDDWFQYSTMYYVQYVDESGTLYDIGSVKIGEYHMKEGQRSPQLPDSFYSLHKGFFSLGQSEDYYDNLKGLEEQERITILTDLNDMAYNLDIYEKCKDQAVTSVSLMRDITEHTVKNQFHRIAWGGVKLTHYRFGYEFPSVIKYKERDYEVEQPANLSFRVFPESNPPTNIHVIIGRNGVGKTFLIKNMIKAVMGSCDKAETGFFYKLRQKEMIPAQQLFANLLCVGFSAFDDLSLIVEKNIKAELPYIFIGLDDNDEGDEYYFRFEKLENQFVESLLRCFTNKSKKKLWNNAMDILNYDNFFAESGITEIELVSDMKKFKREAKKSFSPLSSGHKIILLTITRLVEYVEEKSFIILDEPETHLYPPLLSAFIRALSYILIEKNGVALITTHSPIILQEVPSSCVWKMRRTRSEVVLERPEQETFGTNINSLVREVFGLEVEKSGFHQLLKEVVTKENYDIENIIESFNNELGDEAKAIIRMLIALGKKREEEYEED